MRPQLTSLTGDCAALAGTGLAGSLTAVGAIGALGESSAGRDLVSYTTERNIKYNNKESTLEPEK